MFPVRLLTLVVVTCSLFGAPPAIGADDSAAPPNSSRSSSRAPQPNIVVFYLDDVNPHDGRLWSDPTLTPTLYDLFVAHGTHLPNAIGETPLCCPARGGLLTGLHTHNHGVKENDVRLFNPANHLGRELSDSGYATSMIGKYFNWAERLSATQWQTHADGWTNLDVFMSEAGEGSINYFLDYTLFTKEGPVFYDDVHSTRMIAERAVARMKEAPIDKPIFQLLSIFNPHAPNIPMPEFANEERCRSMPPWNPPNYNEADISDKPAFTRTLPLLQDRDGWPLVAHCRAMLGVDWLVSQVRTELSAEGRLDNTLFVFTADNGMGWGEHRWEKKRMPSTTPLPLYMSWPARWGNDHRVLAESTSNIDVAPTLCEYAGCEMGPFPGGQTHADGLSLAGVLDGDAATLGRDALLETQPGTRSWNALRTTASSALGKWHYVEWATGERELYDLARDPWELQNLAGNPATQQLRDQLSVRLMQLLQEGRIVPSLQRPDGSIAIASVGTFKGLNIYTSVPKDSQTQKIADVLKNTVHDFTVHVTNHGKKAANYTVQGTSTGSGKISTQYLVGGTDVSAAISAGTFSMTGVTPGATVDLVIRMVVNTAPLGSKRSAVLTVGLSGEPTAIDVLNAVVVRAS